VALTGPFGAWVWNLQTQGLSVVNEGKWCARARWASEQRLAVTVGRHVQVYNDEEELLWQSEQLDSTVTDFSWLGGWHKLAIASYGGVTVVEPRKGGVVDHMAFKGSLLAIDSSPNGRWIVSGNQDSSLQVFRSDNDTRLEMEGFPSKITRVAFDHSGKFLANDGAPEVCVWNFGGKGPRGRSPVLLIPQENQGISTIADFAWHPSQTMLAVAWESDGLMVYLPSTGSEGKPLKPLETIHRSEGRLRSITWNHDFDVIIAADSAGSILAFTHQTGTK
jgi:WD40 repeat protein